MNGTDAPSGRLGAVLRSLGQPSPASLGPHGPFLVTSLDHAKIVLTDTTHFDFPMDVSRRALRGAATSGDEASRRSPHAITPPLDRDAVARGTSVFALELAQGTAALSAGSEADAMQLLRAPVARSTTAAVMPELGDPERDRIGDLVLAWIDSLGPIIGSPRNPPRWGRLRRVERRCRRALHESLAEAGCSEPAATAVLLAAGVQVPIAAGAWLLVKLAEDTALAEVTRRCPELARAVAWETLRVCPPTWITPRITSHAVRLGDVDIPEGFVVMVSPLLLGRLESLVPGPVTGESPLERFDPLRWQQTRVRPGAWLPFGAGPHACPGRNLGLAQLTHLAEWAQQWTMSPVHPVHIDQTRGIFPRPAVLTFTTPSSLPPPAASQRHLLRMDPPDMPAPTSPPADPQPGIQAVPDLTPVSAQAGHLAAIVMRGEVGIARALEKVAEHFIAASRVDGVVAALTIFAPDDVQGWVHLGQRAWLREWLRPGSPCRLIPAPDAGPEAALTMPWMSQIIRREVAVIPDVDELPPEGAQDRRELAVQSVKALLGSAQNADGTMYGSLSVVSSKAGPWPQTLVADLRLLSAALTSRMAAEQAKRSMADAIALGDQSRTTQQQFFATIGHELRTPIAAIVGFAEMLADEAHDRGEDDVSSPLEQFRITVERDSGVILRAGEQLLAIVEDLLSTGRVLGAEEPREQVNLSAAIGDIVHWHRTPALARGVTVTSIVAKDVDVHARPSGLRQVLTNLVGNAIVHNRPGGSVEISAAASVGEGGEPRLRIMVRDSGPGLEPGQLSRVFDSFVRFADADVKGTGLGLPLARAVAERDGGVVGAESVPGEGSVFWVDLPAT